MQIPASNLRLDRFHRLVRNCRTEVDEVLPLAILRSPRPKCVANRTSRSDTSFAANVRLSLPEPPGLPLPSCNARWHHRRNVQTATVDTASPSTDQRHNAETDWPTEG